MEDANNDAESKLSDFFICQILLLPICTTHLEYLPMRKGHTSL